MRERGSLAPGRRGRAGGWCQNVSSCRPGTGERRARVPGCGLGAGGFLAIVFRRRGATGAHGADVAGSLEARRGCGRAFRDVPGAWRSASPTLHNVTGALPGAAPMFSGCVWGLRSRPRAFRDDGPRPRCAARVFQGVGGHLGAGHGRFRTSRGHFGVLHGRFRTSRGHFGVLRGRFRTSRGHFGVLRGRFRTSKEHFGVPRGRFRTSGGRLGVPRGRFNSRIRGDAPAGAVSRPGGPGAPHPGSAHRGAPPFSPWRTCQLSRSGSRALTDETHPGADPGSPGLADRAGSGLA